MCPREKISLVPNFVNTEFIRPMDKENDFRREHGLLDKFVLTHAGNVGYVYALDTLLDAAAELREHRGIVFLIIGEGVARADLEKTARERNLDNVRFLPFQPYENLPLVRAASDVQLALYKKRAADYSMPSKVYEAMASGRPLLASAEADSDVARLIRESGVGMCLEPGDAQGLASAVLTLTVDPEGRQAMGSRGRTLAEQQFSRDKVSNQIREMLLEVSRE